MTAWNVFTWNGETNIHWQNSTQFMRHVWSTSFNVLFSQSVTQSVRPSVRPSVSQSVCQSVTVSLYCALLSKGRYRSCYNKPEVMISTRVGRSVIPSVCQSVSQSVLPSVSQSISQSISLSSVSQSVHQSISQSVRPSVRQSVRPSVRPPVSQPTCRSVSHSLDSESVNQWDTGKRLVPLMVSIICYRFVFRFVSLIHFVASFKRIFYISHQTLWSSCVFPSTEFFPCNNKNPRCAKIRWKRSWKKLLDVCCCHA